MELYSLRVGLTAVVGFYAVFCIAAAALIQPHVPATLPSLFASTSIDCSAFVGADEEEAPVRAPFNLDLALHLAEKLPLADAVQYYQEIAQEVDKDRRLAEQHAKRKQRYVPAECIEQIGLLDKSLP